MAKSLPVWIGSQICDDHRPLFGDNYAARPVKVTHRQAIFQALAVTVRQPGRRPQPKVFSISIQKQDRNHQLFISLFLQRSDDELQDLRQWSSLRHHFERYLLTL